MAKPSASAWRDPVVDPALPLVVGGRAWVPEVSPRQSVSFDRASRLLLGCVRRAQNDAGSTTALFIGMSRQLHQAERSAETALGAARSERG
jgi:hypothetical protein